MKYVLFPFPALNPFPKKTSDLYLSNFKIFISPQVKVMEFSKTPQKPVAKACVVSAIIW